MPMWINAETRKRLISASRDNILRIHEFPFTYSFAKVECELFYAILMLWSVSSDCVDWSHLPHVKCNWEKQRKKKKTIAKMYNWSIWNKNLPIWNCFWNVKCHFIYWLVSLHDLKWPWSEMMARCDRISVKDSKDFHSNPGLPFFNQCCVF